MAFPFFYYSGATDADKIILDEETSKHAIQVLRMKEGEQINLTDGKGLRMTTSIIDANRKRCEVTVLSREEVVPPSLKSTIAISLLKNATRFEWFLEKATELGIHQIIPLICQRTEKEKFREERLHQIMVSAMLQSQQCWLPVLMEPVPIAKLYKEETAISISSKFIAHCEEGEKKSLMKELQDLKADRIILIGPEGDFTTQEIESAMQTGYIPVTLGTTRLRTETAGLYAAVLSV
jgi:16S rRNA (uracil1498-N3)-methyltransferase